MDCVLCTILYLKPDPVPCLVTFSTLSGHSYPLKHFNVFIISSPYSFCLKDYVVLLPLYRSCDGTLVLSAAYKH